jgi:hypothetical protein
VDTQNFESFLSRICDILNSEIDVLAKSDAKGFEDRVRAIVREELERDGITFSVSGTAQRFPDISIPPFGLEVKFTNADSWRSIANSVFEGSRSDEIDDIYVVFGKMGGVPSVRWRRYGDCIVHVRTSHVPRFEIDITTNETIFTPLGTTYSIFSRQTDEEKMEYIRLYARKRLKPGERLWWLETPDSTTSGMSLGVKLYMRLSEKEKRQIRAEAALLCPQIFHGSRKRDKYTDAVLYMLTYRGVFCPQARDLFTAGSVALKADAQRGGRYLLRSVSDILPEVLIAAKTLEDRLFIEYWGASVPVQLRITNWLQRIDLAAEGWRPSEALIPLIEKFSED